MTNREKYGEQILDIIARKGCNFGITNNAEIVSCLEINCSDCELVGGCTNNRIKWLNAEYEEPKITIPKDTPVDTKILVSNDGVNWIERHFARVTDDCMIEAWIEGRTSWTTHVTCTWVCAKLPEE